jgi:hypothetical protein
MAYTKLTEAVSKMDARIDPHQDRNSPGHTSENASGLAANLTGKTNLHPFFYTVGVADAGILSPGIKQYDNNRFTSYLRLHH